MRNMYGSKHIRGPFRVHKSTAFFPSQSTCFQRQNIYLQIYNIFKNELQILHLILGQIYNLHLTGPPPPYSVLKWAGNCQPLQIVFTRGTNIRAHFIDTLLPNVETKSEGLYLQVGLKLNRNFLCNAYEEGWDFTFPA